MEPAEDRVPRGGGEATRGTSGTGQDPDDGGATGGASGAEILVVDDNEDCRLALRTVLESLGYGVHEAGDGEAAVEAARRLRPDLVLMDIMMPGMDGLEATRRIRGDAPGGNPCIVAVSAMEGAREASLDAGCDDCLPKPIDLREMEERIRRWLSESAPDA